MSLNLSPAEGSFGFLSGWNLIACCSPNEEPQYSRSGTRGEGAGAPHESSVGLLDVVRRARYRQSSDARAAARQHHSREPRRGEATHSSS